MQEGVTGQSIRVELAAGEEHEFGDITFTMPGTYKYTISEVNDGNEDYDFDESVYEVTYVVTQNGRDLTCVRTFQKDGKDVTIATFEFNNVYTGGDKDKNDDKDKKDNDNNGNDNTKDKTKKTVKTKTVAKSNVSTGDEINLLLWSILIVAALLIMTIIVFRRRKDENR